MAATYKPNAPARAQAKRTVSDQPPRTIEDIEREAQEILAAEQRAIGVLVDCIREIAVQLPAMSRLSFELAKAARSLEAWSGDVLPNPSLGVKLALSRHSEVQSWLRES
jgi:hypothetical protein